MEQIQSSMVNQDVVTNLESTVDTLRAELKRLDGTHRQLLVRYASLKGIVDDCFKRFEQESPLGISFIALLPM
jgi:chaperonin cofactor prefoldin